MKKMLATLAIIALSFSASAKERTVNFSIFVINSYFSCDHVENVTTKYIEALGATAVDVNCRGGLPYDQWTRVEAIIDSASADEDNTVLNAVNVNSRKRPYRRITENCSLGLKVIEGILPAFDVTDVKKRNGCYGSEGRFSFDMTVRSYN